MICEKCSHTRSCKKVIGLYENSCNNFNVSAKYFKLLTNCKVGDILYFLNIHTPSIINVIEAVVKEKDFYTNSIDTELASSGTRIRIGGTNRNIASLFYTNKDELIDEIKNNKKIKRSTYIGFINYYTIKE